MLTVKDNFQNIRNDLAKNDIVIDAQESVNLLRYLKFLALGEYGKKEKDVGHIEVAVKWAITNAKPLASDILRASSGLTPLWMASYIASFQNEVEKRVQQILQQYNGELKGTERIAVEFLCMVRCLTSPIVKCEQHHTIEVMGKTAWDILAELRPQSSMRSTAQQQLDKSVADVLGLSRQDVLNLSNQSTFDEVRARLEKENMWDQEYDNQKRNGSYDTLRGVLMKLFDSLVAEAESIQAQEAEDNHQTTKLDLENAKLSEIVKRWKSFPSSKTAPNTDDITEFLRTVDAIIREVNEMQIYEEERRKRKSATLTMETVRAHYDRIIRVTPAFADSRLSNKYAVATLGKGLWIENTVSIPNVSVREFGIRTDKAYKLERKAKQTSEAVLDLDLCQSDADLTDENSLGALLAQLYFAEFPLKTLEIDDESVFTFHPEDSHTEKLLRLAPERLTQLGTRYLFHSQSVISTSAEEIPFHRLLVEVQLNDPNQSVSQLLKHLYASKVAIAESAETICGLIDAIRFNAENPNEPVGWVSKYPSVLYHVSPTIMQHPDMSSLRAAIVQHWKYHMEIPNRYDPLLLAESKDMVLELLSSKIHKSVAIVREEHLRYINYLLNHCTHHTSQTVRSIARLVSITIERSNFQSVMGILSDLNKKCTTLFVIIRVVGKLSEIEMKSMVETQSNQSIRLLIVSYARIIATMRMIDFHNKLVSSSIEDEVQYKSSTYDLTSFSRHIFDQSSKYFADDLTRLKCDEALNDITRKLDEAQYWMKKETQWRDTPIDMSSPTDVENNMYRLIVSKSDSIVDRHYKETNKVIVESAHQLDMERLLTRLKEISKMVPPFDSTLVVFKAHLLSQEQKKFIASSCLGAHIRLVMVVPIFHPNWMTMKTREPKTFRDVSLKSINYFLTPTLARNNSELSRDEIILSTAYMIFGPLVSDVRLHDSTLLSDQLENCATALVGPTGVSVDLIKGAVAGIVSLPASPTELSTASLPNLFYEVLCECVKLAEAGGPLVSFYDYVTLNPLCQFLPQHLIVESWLRTVLHMGEGVSNSIVEASAQQTRSVFSNEHTVHLLAFFSQDAKGGADPAYRYMEVDSTTNSDELTLYQTANNEELNWNQLSVEWSNPPFSAHFFMQVLSIYHSPMKLAWVIEPLSLFMLLEYVSSSANKAIQQKCLGTLFTNKALANLSDHLATQIPRWKLLRCVIKWTLLVNGSLNDVDMSADELNTIIEGSIPLKVSSLLRRQAAVSHLLAIDTTCDTPNLFFSKVEFREYLLSVPETEAQVWCESDTTFGSALVEFIMHPNVAIQSDAPGRPKFVSGDLWRALKTEWFEKNSKPHPDKLRLIRKLTLNAVGYLLSCAPSSDHVKTFITIQDAYITEKKLEDPVGAVTSILDIASSFKPSDFIIPAYLDNIASDNGRSHAELRKKLADKKFSSARLTAIVKSQMERSLDAWNAFVSDAGNDSPILPVRYSRILRRLFIDQFERKSIKITDVANKVFDQLDQADSRELFVELNKSGTKEQRLLLLVLWLINPDLELTKRPSRPEMEDILMVLNSSDKVNFKRRVLNSIAQASNLALFLACPAYLDDTTLRHFQEQFEKSPTPRFFNIHKQTTCYVPARALPEAEVLKMYQEIPNSEWDKEPLLGDSMFDDADSFQSAVMPLLKVSSGASSELLAHNIRLLAELLASYDIEDYSEFKPTIVLICRVVVVWLWALGVSSDMLDSIFKKRYPEVQAMMDRFIHMDDNTSNSPFYVDPDLQIPFQFPTIINVTLVSKRPGSLWGHQSGDEILFTLHRVSGILNSISKGDLVKFHNVEGITKHHSDLSRYNELPTKFAGALGHEVGTLRGIKENPHDSLEIVSSFINIVDATTDPALQEDMLREFVAEFIRVPHDKASEAKQAILSRTLFSCIGTQRPRLLEAAIVKVLLPLCQKKQFVLADYIPTEYGDLALVYSFRNIRISNPPDLQNKEYLTAIEDKEPDSLSGHVLFVKQTRLATRHFAEPRTDAPANRLQSNENNSRRSATSSKSACMFHAHKKTAATTAATTSDATILSSKPINLTSYGQCIVLCSDLIQLVPSGCFSTIKITPGQELCLIHEQKNIFRVDRLISATDDSKQTNRDGVSPLNSLHLPESTRRVHNKQVHNRPAKVVASFNDHGEAASWLMANLPPLSIMVSKTILMKRHLAGAGWGLISLPERRLNFVQVLDTFRLLNLSLPDSVQKLLHLASHLLFNLYQRLPEAPYQVNAPLSEISRSAILPQLRKLQIKENNAFGWLLGNVKSMFVDIISKMSHSNDSLDAIIKTALQDSENQLQNTMESHGMKLTDSEFRQLCDWENVFTSLDDDLKRIQYQLLCSVGHFPLLQSIFESTEKTINHIVQTSSQVARTISFAVSRAGVDNQDDEDVSEYTDMRDAARFDKIVDRATAAPRDEYNDLLLANIFNEASGEDEVPDEGYTSSYDEQESSYIGIENEEDRQDEPADTGIPFTPIKQQISPQKAQSSCYGGKEDATGFGDCSVEVHRLTSIDGRRIPLVVYRLDPAVHRNLYNIQTGQTLGYVLSEAIYQQKTERGKPIVDHAFGHWVIHCLRAPLHKDTRDWILNNVLCSSFAAPPTIESAIERVVALCLARACPDDNIKAMLSNVFRFEGDILKYCERRGNIFGVQVCSSTAYAGLLKHQLDPYVIDLSLDASSGTATPDSLYLRIISCFSASRCIVYVRGLEVVEDSLLKWICEYTRNFPWRFCFLENVSTLYNFAENRDRLLYHLYPAPSLAAQQSKYGNNLNVETVQYTTIELSPTILSDGVSDLINLLKKYSQSWGVPNPDRSKASLSQSERDWQVKVKQLIANHQKLFVLVISPPGAGKTYLLNHVIQEQAQNGIECHNLDCSSGILVERTISSLLDELFPEEGKPGFLVADEFHMLNSDHKKELFGWALLRLHYIKVICVGNRENEDDFSLLEGLKRKADSSVRVERMSCRLAVQTILDTRKNQDSKPRDSKATESFTRLWHRALRMLFSEEAVSLRHVEGYMKAFASKEVLRDKAVELEALLLEKLPYIGDRSAAAFTQAVLEIHDEAMRAEESNRKYSFSSYEATSSSSPFKLLVQTALADEDDKLWSFKDFTRHFKVAHEIHPIVRFALWIVSIYGALHPKEPILRIAQTLNLRALLKFEIIDQAAFPIIQNDEGSASTLNSCRTLAKRGDFTDLLWLKKSIEHGYSVNWAEVQKCWTDFFIHDAAEFTQLLSVCPNPGIVLSSIAPHNLHHLVTKSDGTGLAAKILQYSTAPNTMESRSPYYHSAWLILRFSTDPEKALKEFNVNLKDLLIWAGQFGFSAMSTTLDPATCEASLYHLLIKLSVATYESTPRNEEAGKEIAKFWTQLFAPLLTKAIESQPSSQFKAAVLLMCKSVTHNPAWPQYLIAVQRLLNTKATEHDLQDLIIHSELETLQPILVNGDGLIADEDLINGVLTARGEDTKPIWLAYILRTPFEMTKDQFANIPHRALESALGAINADAIKIVGECAEELEKFKHSRGL